MIERLIFFTLIDRRNATYVIFPFDLWVSFSLSPLIHPASSKYFWPSSVSLEHRALLKQFWNDLQDRNSSTSEDTITSIADTCRLTPIKRWTGWMLGTFAESTAWISSRWRPKRRTTWSSDSSSRVSNYFATLRFSRKAPIQATQRFTMIHPHCCNCKHETDAWSENKVGRYRFCSPPKEKRAWCCICSYNKSTIEARYRLLGRFGRLYSIPYSIYDLSVHWDVWCDMEIHEFANPFDARRTRKTNLLDSLRRPLRIDTQWP